MIYRLLIVIGLLLECLAATLLLQGQTPMVLMAAALAHAGACVGFTRGIYPFLSARYRVFRRQVAGFLFSIQFVLPVIGTVGCWVAFFLAARPGADKPELAFRVIELPELPFQAPGGSARTHYSEGGLSQVLHSAVDLKKRVEAIIATRQMQKQLAIPLLQEALRDPADDVRLLAYSLLDTAEKQLSDRITLVQKRLLLCPAEKRNKVQLNLCQQYWEMIFLGLVSGNNRETMLQKAFLVLNDIIRIDPFPAALHLQGRVSLEMRLPAKAALRFRQAMEAGGSPEKNLPYLAEALFELKQYHLIPGTLSSLRQTGSYWGKHEALMAFWINAETGDARRG